MDGTDGEPGTDGVSPFALTGTVNGPAGPAAEAIVVVQVLSNDGEVLTTAGFDRADANGTYSIDLLNVDAPDTYLLVSASTDEGIFDAHLAAETQDVSVETHAVAQIVGQIIGTEHGRSVSDYTPDEIADSVAEVSAALAGVDLSDSDAVYTAALEGAGEAIADRSEGDIR